MHLRLRHAFRIMGALALAVALAPAARADFEILVTENGGATIPIVDGGPLDTNPADGAITVNAGGLNALLTDFTFDSLGASSNRSTGTAFSNDFASVSQTGTVSRSTTGSTATITITAFDTDFQFPSNDPKTLTTAASDTFRFTTADTNRTFQSSFDPTNSTPPGPGITSPLLVFVPPVGTGPFGTSEPGQTTDLGAQPLPFGLANTTVITLGSSTAGAQSDQFTGASTITAVPEPASACLIVVGLGLLASRRLRSRTPRA